jgi:hypothetical protein
MIRTGSFRICGMFSRAVPTFFSFLIEITTEFLSVGMEGCGPMPVLFKPFDGLRA